MLLRYAYKLVDLLVDYWPLVEWWIPGVAMINAWAFSWWAAISGLSSVEIITIALAATATTLAIGTYLPRYINQRLPRPFKISASSVLAWEQQGDGHLQVEVFVINRSPKKESIILEFALCVHANDGNEHWFRKPLLHGLTRGIDPGKHAEGTVDFHVGALSQILGVGPKGLYLYIEDLLSERSIRIPITGAYPSYFIMP